MAKRAKHKSKHAKRRFSRARPNHRSHKISRGSHRSHSSSRSSRRNSKKSGAKNWSLLGAAIIIIVIILLIFLSLKETPESNIPGQNAEAATFNISYGILTARLNSSDESAVANLIGPDFRSDTKCADYDGNIDAVVQEIVPGALGNPQNVFVGFLIKCPNDDNRFTYNVIKKDGSWTIQNIIKVA